MPTTLVTDLQAAVGAGGTVDVQPAAGHEYCIYEVGNDVAFVGNVPDIQTAIRDGVLADAIVQIDPTTDPGMRVSQLELYISNANWLRITNTGGAGANVSWVGEEVRPGLTVTDLVAIGVGATVNIQPPLGQTWRITQVGTSTWAAVDINPDVNIGITDGVLTASAIRMSVNLRGQDRSPCDWIIDNANYLWVTDMSGAGLVFGYSGRIVPHTCISDVQDVAGAATLDILPPATEEWEITEFSAETWAGVGVPNNYPDISVSVMVGAVLSEVLEAGSVATSLRWNSRIKLQIDNTHWLRITNVNVGANECGWLGFLKRQYS